MRFKEGTAPAAPQPAPAGRFRLKDPLPDAQKNAFAPGLRQEFASVLRASNLFEAKHKQKEKGAIRKASEPPSDHWLIAWVVWSYYIDTYSRAGLRASEVSNRADVHKKNISGLGK